MYEYYFTFFNFVIHLLVITRCNATNSTETIDNGVIENLSPLEIRSVLLSCDSEVNEGFDTELLRFQRQELFKHCALKDCDKKLAVSIKMKTHPRSFSQVEGSTTAGIEYVPIDHAFEGANKKRVRLLNPYAVRLRREKPLQVYKLRRIDTVTGTLTNTRKNREEHDEPSDKQSRFQRKDDTGQDDFSMMLGSPNSYLALDHDGPAGRNSYSLRIKPESLQDGLTIIRDKKQLCLLNKSTCENENYKSNNSNNFQNKSDSGDEEEKGRKIVTRSSHNHNRKIHSQKIEHIRTHSAREKHNTNSVHNRRRVEYFHEVPPIVKHYQQTPEKDYAMYEISNPSIWFGVAVQIFEKMDTSDGKTIWNDLTRETDAKVNAVSPEWRSRDVYVKYRPVDWLPPEDFTLPTAKLCLLEPLGEDLGNNTYKMSEYDPESVSYDNNQNYVIVPLEDVVSVKEYDNSLLKRDYKSEDEVNVKENDNNLLKREHNLSTTDKDDSFTTLKKKRHRVRVRVSRAIFGNKVEDKFDIVNVGDDLYLTMPHRRLYRSAIDLEIRADNNQFVHAGSSGRLAVVVTDSTRNSRSVITVQATNTGLTSAEFRVKASDCDPELTNLLNEKMKKERKSDNKLNEEIEAGPVLLAPECTRRFYLTLPVHITDTSHCVVTLLNANDETVAVRDVVLKMADRCFCVSHCKCTCLSDDPKLQCNEMSSSQQMAAGLVGRDHQRQARYVCYPNNALLNAAAIFVGINFIFLLLGFIKAVIGLKVKSLALWGINYIVQIPRPLDHYYEKDLRDCYEDVCYDEEGWPVHPRTFKRTVSVVSGPMEFLLNVIFFLALPCVLLCTGVRSACAAFRSCATKASSKIYKSKNTVYSSQSLQDLDIILRLRKREPLRRWMSPGAEKLIQDVVKEGKSQEPFERGVQTKGRQREIRKPVSKRLLYDGDISASETVNEEKKKSRESMKFANRQQAMLDAVKTKPKCPCLPDNTPQPNQPKCECVPGSPRSICPNAPNKERCPSPAVKFRSYEDKNQYAQEHRSISAHRDSEFDTKY